MRKALLGFGAGGRFGDLAALDALGAGLNLFDAGAFLMADRLKIGLPELIGFVVGVRNVVAVLSRFTADITYARHGSIPFHTARTIASRH